MGGQSHVVPSAARTPHAKSRPRRAGSSRMLARQRKHAQNPVWRLKPVSGVGWIGPGLLSLTYGARYARAHYRFRRRAAGSRSATCRATASAPGRAYRSRKRTDAWRERASSIGVGAGLPVNPLGCPALSTLPQ